MSTMKTVFSLSVFSVYDVLSRSLHVVKACSLAARREVWLAYILFQVSVMLCDFAELSSHTIPHVTSRSSTIVWLC